MSDFRLQLWAEGQRVTALREIAVGMPYRSSARKYELIAWLLKHNPNALQRAKEAKA